MTDAPTRRWTPIGLAIALLGMPVVIGVFNYLHLPINVPNVLAREGALFALAAALFFIIRRGEALGWDSIGLQRPALGNTALWVLIALVLSVAAIAAALGISHLAGWHFGGSDKSPYDALPLWAMFIVVLRAGTLEELFYRGYAIERLQAMTGSRLVSVGVPLVLFAVFHYRQGMAGITIALLTGAVLTWVYLKKRNLWINMTAHFLVDFIPNIAIPLFTGE